MTRLSEDVDVIEDSDGEESSLWTGRVERADDVVSSGLDLLEDLKGLGRGRELDLLERSGDPPELQISLVVQIKRKLGQQSQADAVHPLEHCRGRVDVLTSSKHPLWIPDLLAQRDHTFEISLRQRLLHNKTKQNRRERKQ
jgi:hypothetical protein